MNIKSPSIQYSGAHPVNFGTIIEVKEITYALLATTDEGYQLIITDAEFERLYAAYVGNEPFTLEELVGTPEEANDDQPK